MTPIKKKCFKRQHSIPATFYTKSTTSEVSADHIETQQNEVYGVSLQLMYEPGQQDPVST